MTSSVLLFLKYLLLFLIIPAVVLGLVVVVIGRYGNNRKYLEYEEEVYEGRKSKTDMPKEPYDFQ